MHFYFFLRIKTTALFDHPVLKKTFLSYTVLEFSDFLAILGVTRYFARSR
jgi:hypothetical protein